jgi:DNA polymerase-3 subunit gamma/tau
VDFVEQDAASHNSVEDIRQLRENVALTPMAGGRKVYLLDEVHMLSNAAENALLKTLEEPPPHIIFVLATTDVHKVSSTIVSRCQRYDLKRIPMSAVVGRLEHICQAEGFVIERDGLSEIARSATGSLRDAINALQQVVSHYGEAPSLEQIRETLGLSVDARSGELARMILFGDLPDGLRLITKVSDDGTDMKHFTRQVVRYLRATMLAKAGVSEQSRDLPGEMVEEAAQVAREAPRDSILTALRIMGRVEFEGKSASSLPLELGVIDAIEEIGAGPIGGVETRAPVKPPAPEAFVDRGLVGGGAAPLDGGQAEGEAAPPPPTASTPPPVEQSHDSLLERVRASLKEGDKQLSALLNGSCEVLSIEGDDVVIGFYHTFHLERIERGSYGDALERAFSGELGRPVKIAYEHAPRERPESAAVKRGGHLVQAARELGARPVPPEA